VRVLHVILSIDPRFGGLASCATSLAAAQAHAGHDVAIAYHRTIAQEELFKVVRCNVDHVDELRLADIPQDGPAERVLASGAAARLAGLVAQSDIVHLHGIWDPIIIRAGLIARRLNRPYVVSPHGMLNPWSLQQSRWRKRIMFALATDRVLRNSLFVHALNPIEADAIGSISDRYRVRILPNGIFASRYARLPAKGTFQARHPELDKRRFILFLGRLHHVKGLDFMAEAFSGFSREIGDVDLVVSGPDGGAREAFEQEIKRLNIEGRVHIVGPLYGDIKYAAMADAICLFQPSRQEGFSMSILEAMASGIPVVVSHNCHFPEVAAHQCGSVVPLDPTAMTKALVDIARDPLQAQAMGSAGHELALRDYTWDRIGERFIESYEDG